MDLPKINLDTTNNQINPGINNVHNNDPNILEGGIVVDDNTNRATVAPQPIHQILSDNESVTKDEKNFFCQSGNVDNITNQQQDGVTNKEDGETCSKDIENINNPPNSIKKFNAKKDVRIIKSDPLINIYQKGMKIILCAFKIFTFSIRMTINSRSIMVHGMMNYDMINPSYHKFLPYPHDYKEIIQLGVMINPNPIKKLDDVQDDVISYYFKVLSADNSELTFPSYMIVYPRTEMTTPRGLLPGSFFRNLNTRNNGTNYLNNTTIENNRNNEICRSSQISEEVNFPFLFTSLFDNSRNSHLSSCTKEDCLENNFTLLKSTSKTMLNTVHLQKDSQHYEHIKIFSVKMWDSLFSPLSKLYKFVHHCHTNNERLAHTDVESFTVELDKLRKLTIDFYFEDLKNPRFEIWKKFLLFSSQLIECLRQHIKEDLKEKKQMSFRTVDNVPRLFDENQKKFYKLLDCAYFNFLVQCYDYNPREKMMFLASSKKFLIAFDVDYLSSQFDEKISSFDSYLVLLQQSLSIFGFKLLNDDSPVLLKWDNREVLFEVKDKRLVFCLDVDDSIFYDIYNSLQVNLLFEFDNLEVSDASSEEEEESSDSSIGSDSNSDIND